MTRVGAACLGDGTAAFRHGQGLLRVSTLSAALIGLTFTLRENDLALRPRMSIGDVSGLRWYAW